MRWLGILAATAALSLSTVAHAESSPVAPDPENIQLAQELFELSGGQRNAETMIHTLYGSMGKLVDAALPPEKAKLAKSIQGAMEQELLRALPELTRVTLDIYARNLTQQELRDYNQFLKSDTGRSVVAKMPALLQQAVAAQQPLLQAMLPRVMKKAVETACEEAKCSAADRQQVTELMGRALTTPKS